MSKRQALFLYALLVVAVLYAATIFVATEQLFTHPIGGTL